MASFIRLNGHNASTKGSRSIASSRMGIHERDCGAQCAASILISATPLSGTTVQSYSSYCLLTTAGRSESTVDIYLDKAGVGTNRPIGKIDRFSLPIDRFLVNRSILVRKIDRFTRIGRRRTWPLIFLKSATASVLGL